MDLNKKLEELKPYQLNCNVFDVYSYNGLSMQDLLCQFFTKINECINVSNETIDLAKWLVNEGLEIEVVKKLMLWLEDGTLENIINVNIFNTLNEKINGLSSQLEHNINQMISKRIESVFGSNRCILHRGACTVAPEQTIASFQIAKKLGVKVVEIDVWKTLDNDFVVFHDSTLDDKTNGTGKVEEKTLVELKTLNFTKGANLDKYPNLKILSFDECMKLLNELGLNVLIDFKTYTLDKSVYSNLIQKIKDNGMLNRVAIATWWGSQIKIIRDLEKDICLGIEQVSNEDEWNYILNNNIDFAFLTKGTYLTQENIKRLHDNNRYCIGFSVNTLDEIKTYTNYGVNYFVLDNIFNGGN